MKKKRTTKVTTPEIENDEEEDIEKDVFESESDRNVVASDRSISKWRDYNSDPLPLDHIIPLRDYLETRRL
jgi:hypothetical protein